MLREIQTIRRSKELAPLSREHHDGLLFVWHLREGLKKKIALDRIKKYCFWYWQNHIKPHFRHEEDILLTHIPGAHPLGIRMVNEHEMIRELILDLDEEVNQRTLTLLADLIDGHIRFEEKELFAWFEKNLPAAELTKIEEMLEKKPLHISTEWEDKFWQ